MHSPNSPYIDALPDEILVQIFLMRYMKYEYNPPCRPELLVCRRWTALINSSPLLWTTIAFVRNGRRRFIDFNGLERSRNALIDIRVDIDEPLPDRLYNLLEDNAHRFRTLEIDIDSPDGSLLSYTSIFRPGKETFFSMPNLKVFRIGAFLGRDAKHEDVKLLIVPPWHGMENLVKLELFEISLANVPTAAGVIDLRIGELQPVQHDTLELLFQRFPILEFLELQNFYPDQDEPGSPNPDDRSPIHAPFLRTLVLGARKYGREHFPDCICGLQHLVAPNIELVELHGDRLNFVNKLHGNMWSHATPGELRKLRICPEMRFSKAEMRFFASLPKFVDLELRELPGDSAHFIMDLLQSLGNLNSLTVDLLVPTRYQFPDAAKDLSEFKHQSLLNPVNFVKIVRKHKPILACATYVRVSRDEWIPQDVRDILGEKLVVLVCNREDWIDTLCEQFADAYGPDGADSNSENSDYSIDGREASDSDSDAESNDASDTDAHTQVSSRGSEGIVDAGSSQGRENPNDEIASSLH